MLGRIQDVRLGESGIGIAVQVLIIWADEAWKGYRTKTSTLSKRLPPVIGGFCCCLPPTTECRIGHWPVIGSVPPGVVPVSIGTVPR